MATDKPSFSLNVKRRVMLVQLVFSMAALAILVQVFFLQGVKGAHWRLLAEQRLITQDKVPATRGNIYAGDGESLLATSLPFYKVVIDPTVSNSDVFKSSVDSLALLLSRYFKDKSAAEYRAEMVTARKEGRRYLTLNRERINYQDKKEMLNWPLARLGRTKGGVFFEQEYRRYNPFRHLARRTIGFQTDENVGVGLENAYNTNLAGQEGISLFRKIAGSYRLPIEEQRPPVEGVDIETTIDVNLQDVAETALENALIRHQAAFGGVALMEVATGEIKAIANLTLKDDRYVENYNYIIGGRTEPGSTIKLASYLALMEEMGLSVEDTVYAHYGKFRIADRDMTDSKPGGYGTLTVQQAFERSSNIVISKLVNRHFGKDPNKFIDYLEKFGLTQKLDMPIKGAKVPYVKRPGEQTWSGTSLPWMSVGYELEVTPLQTLTLYNAIANDGRMIEPIIVRKIRRADKTIEEFKAKVLREQICSESNLKQLRQMLEGVVENGTASNVRHADYKIAGKTGTAQKLVNKRYTQRYYTSFAGYFPADNPKYSCIVIIDDPKGYQQYGSDVAAPVFKELADKVYARDMELHRSFRVEKREKDADFPVVQTGHYGDLNYLLNHFGISNHTAEPGAYWVKAQLQNSSIKWRQQPVKYKRIPDVRGMTLRDAVALLENNGIRVSYSGRGRVKSQSMPPGQAIVGRVVLNLELDS